MGGGEGSPTYGSMLPQEQQPPDMTGAGMGQNQAGNAAMRLAMELDASMKLLAQMVPQLGPWAEMATSQLRDQLGQALMNGDVPTGAEPTENAMFPGGQGRL
jgi:hypothetical protein